LKIAHRAVYFALGDVDQTACERNGVTVFIEVDVRLFSYEARLSIGTHDAMIAPVARAFGMSVSPHGADALRILGVIELANRRIGGLRLEPQQRQQPFGPSGLPGAQIHVPTAESRKSLGPAWTGGAQNATIAPPIPWRG